ncbi:MAG: gamma-glutamyl-gamma-aminobutyrate hydrolase family protein [Candidatus Cloacimonadota bacterium]|nr:MAG: gamma-glutamyl-gamma-aminobutyrate hydrolase family protein [Candidatus Cloacimonadota bacterium]
MKPIIGINMCYSEYDGYEPGDLKFRDAYKVYTSYADVVQRSGGIALLIPPFPELNFLDDYIEIAQGFIFTGGDDYPPELYNEDKHSETKLIHKRRADADIYLVKNVLQTDKPVLAICGGIQLVSIALGGKLIQHLKDLETHNKISRTVDNTHKVNILKSSLLYEIFNKDEILVNSAHHQAVSPDAIGDGLRITATAPDGVIEALELKKNPKGRYFLALQWHPERVSDGRHRKLVFDAFIAAAKMASS